jgi:hypothetical protein
MELEVNAPAHHSVPSGLVKSALAANQGAFAAGSPTGNNVPAGAPAIESGSSNPIVFRAPVPYYNTV